ncbi:MAG: 3-phenylpropionate/cinnamic acid dioxygenase subunit beta [Gammaproteobacteria bacterium]|nr:3-phenylpropionate/cinnamic acid dioxygenase subunit beta [Gammaproteobacteria bacterium]
MADRRRKKAQPSQNKSDGGHALQHEIEQFLYAEARLLDDRNMRGWFDLLADDLSYRMPLRTNRLARERHLEFSSPGESLLFDETKASIDMRIRRLETGVAWAEEPPSRTRHLVTNVQIQPNGEDEVRVHCYLHVYRARLERQVDEFVGEREDLLRRVDAPLNWQIVDREIRLDQTTVLSNNISIFF